MEGCNITTEVLDIIAPTKVIYELGAQEIMFRVRAPPEYPGCPAMDRWGEVWSKRSTLLFMLKGKQEAPRQELLVWRIFRRLFLPKWDMDFIRRTLWKKLPINGRMGHRVGNGKCPICGRLEDHEHVLRHCMFSAFCFDTVRKALGLVQKEGGGGDRAQQAALGGAGCVPAEHAGAGAVGRAEGPVVDEM